jgi:hypothetical protein
MPPSTPVSFAQHILPLFTDRDIACMRRYSVRLGDPDYMLDQAGNDLFADHANARDVYVTLSAPRRRGCRWADRIGRTTDFNCSTSGWPTGFSPEMA